MILVITVDIDVKESGLDAEEIKENITQFTRDLLTFGAEEQEIGLTLKEVEYSEEPSDEYIEESSGSFPFPFHECIIDCLR